MAGDRSKNIVVIGAGFSGLASSACLALSGHNVTVVEKHEMAGGRARIFQKDGFTFDMGPSWYWMPDVFEKYFNLFGKSASDFYQLKRLDPSYRVYFGESDYLDIPSTEQGLYELFENEEKGSSNFLKKFLTEAKYKYEVGVNDLVYRPGRSITEFFDLRLLLGVLKLDVFNSFHVYIRKYFKSPKLLQLLEFPVLFLGAKPQDTPALYSLMNYADMVLGTWYPMGGMHKIVEGMQKIAQDQGVKFEFNQNVTSIDVENKIANNVRTDKGNFKADIVVGSADYNHVEQVLLPKGSRVYSDDYWQKRVMAPSSLIFYLGISKKLKNLLHHNLFFDQDFGKHAVEIYDNPQWPTNPLFYVSCPSVTDDTLAPEGYENIFILIPVAPGLQDTDEIKEKYYHLVMDRLEKLTKQEIKESVIYKRAYAHKDFISDYNAFKGNAYGLANTLLQTAILKPALKSKKINNFYYTGQLTVPGPGVPPSIISGQVVAKEINKDLKFL